MLVLSRKLNERIRIGPDIWIEVVRLTPDRVQLAIDAPPDVKILREELLTAPVHDIGGEG